MTSDDVRDWFASYPTGTEYVHSDGHGLFFDHPESDCIELEYPAKLERLPFFARLLSTLGYEDDNFEGALIWLTDWGVWSLPEEAVGYHVVEQMNRASGQPSAFESSPGHMFRGDELTDAIALLLQPIMFSWDAYFLPRWSYGTDEFFLFVSHDSFVSVVTRTAAFHQKVFQILQEVELGPKRGSERQKGRFCRTT